MSHDDTVMLQELRLKVHRLEILVEQLDKLNEDDISKIEKAIDKLIDQVIALGKEVAVSKNEQENLKTTQDTLLEDLKSVQKKVEENHSKEKAAIYTGVIPAVIAAVTSVVVQLNRFIVGV